MKLEEARKRIEILLTDDCDCTECLKNKEAYKTILNYIDNSIPKEVIKEKKTKIKQEHQDIICNNTLAMLDRMINSKLTQGKLEILDELLDTNERR